MFPTYELRTCEISSILRCVFASTDLRLSKLGNRPLVIRTVDVSAVVPGSEWIWLITSLKDEALAPELGSLISSRQYTIPDCETCILGAHPIRHERIIPSTCCSRQPLNTCKRDTTCCMITPVTLKYDCSQHNRGSHTALITTQKLKGDVLF